jgi:hypothetical protein
LRIARAYVLGAEDGRPEGTACTSVQPGIEPDEFTRHFGGGWDARARLDALDPYAAKLAALRDAQAASSSTASQVLSTAAIAHELQQTIRVRCTTCVGLRQMCADHCVRCARCVLRRSRFAAQRLHPLKRPGRGPPGGCRACA